MENFIKEVEVDGISHSITLGDDMVGSGLKKNENGVVSLDINEDKLVKITYSELKSLRDNSQLTPGSFYRITDYVTTTTQSETKSANHPFDVIVLALSENTLCEDAKAILHEGDTYFADSDLNAWELKYCLDNDKTRFEWADEANGKGVIFRMIDEKQNDCPYDFKNILIYNTMYTDSDVTSDKYYYTFSYVINKVLYDGTTEAQVKNCYGNSMKEYKSSGKVLINKNVFRNTSRNNSCHSNRFGNDCHSNRFGNNCNSNTFGNNCDSNTFDIYCYSNTFGTYCNSNTFGIDCNSNTFGNYCYSNTFGNSCSYNTFGNSCSYNTFGNSCSYNTFGNDCDSRKLEGDSEKTFITLSEEFYDDGSGQVVPIKHPDLSTQPSILPYKFMGQYVYEILLPIPDIDLSQSTYYVDARNLLEYVKDQYAITILQAEELLFCHKEVPTPYPSIPMFVHRNISISTLEQYGGTAVYSLRVNPDKTYSKDIAFTGDVVKAYLKITYTQMPKEGGDYYGYNNY